MPKDLRKQQVKEIRNSHFTFGYEPTKPNMITSKCEEPDFVSQKWNLGPTLKVNHMPAAKQNFSITNNAKVFYGQTTQNAAQQNQS